jgi:hypothetical protein
MPAGIDLTLERYDPVRPDARWVAEVIDDVRDVLVTHLERGNGCVRPA